MNPEKGIFVDVDTQKDFMNPDGRLYVKGAETLKGNLRRLFAYAQKKGIPIVSSVDTHVPDDPEFRIFPPHCVRGTEGHEKIDETTTGKIRRFPATLTEVIFEKGDQIVLEKSIYSLFDNKNADTVLGKLGRKEVIIFGVATDFCVRAAVLGFLERGFRVTVVSDGVMPVTLEGGRKAEEEMRGRGAFFASTEEILGKE